MSLLNTVNTDQETTEGTDFAGSTGPRESGLYPYEVIMAWFEKKTSGALFMNLTFKFDDGGEYKEGLCIASGDAKGNKNYYENAKGEKHGLPGFNHANSLTRLACGKDVLALDTEEKTIGVYNFDAKADVMTKVEVAMELLGTRGIVGLQKQIVDKQAKNDSGVYANTGETREINKIDKFFRERDQMTTAEIMAGAEAPAFYATWDQKNTGKTRNKATAANDANGASGTPGKTAPAAAGGGKAVKSLFV